MQTQLDPDLTLSTRDKKTNAKEKRDKYACVKKVIYK